jgi:hypothetical protein
MHLCGVNPSEIAKRLNNNKTKKSSDPRFSRTTITIILQNYGFIKIHISPKSRSMESKGNIKSNSTSADYCDINTESLEVDTPSDKNLVSFY